VIPLSDGETVVKRGAELSCSGRAEVLGPNGSAVENILLPAIQARPNVLRRWRRETGVVVGSPWGNACTSEVLASQFSYMLLIDLHHEKASLGAYALRAQTREHLEHALIEAREHNRTSVVVQRVVGYESWWDVPITETFEKGPVR
jgi:hypothetical protein